ncbi:type IV pilus modification PilV family protein [Frateuria aurantia]
MKMVQHGFSLIEVMAAIAVMTLALTALLTLAARSSQLQQRASTQVELSLDARSLLDGAFATGPPTVGTWRGQLSDGCRWRLRSSRLDAAKDSSDVHLYQLDLDLSTSGYGPQRSYRFTTLRVGPGSASDAAL